MSTSTVSVVGARPGLREGQIVKPEDYSYEQSWYVGGQSARSYAVAWQLLENLLDMAGWRLPEHFGEPHPCASVRFGNCLVLRVERVR